MKRFISVVLSIITMMTITAFAGETKEAGEMLIYGSGDYTRINPVMDEHGEINILLFDGLTAHDGDNNVVPRLADSWEYDEENITYTFHLHEGVKWHDEEPFTAEDVKFTIEAIMNPDNGSENAPNFEEIDSIKVIDELTIEFKLSASNVAFLDYMTMPILPKHLLEGEDWQTSDFFRNPIGTGAFKLTEWDRGQAIILDRNEEYFMGQGRGNIGRIIFKIVPEDSAKALQLQSGELDLAQVTPKDSLVFDGNEEYQVYDMKTSDYRGILYNFRNEFWQKNADLIPAINYAIDRETIVNAILLGKGNVAYGPLQRNIYNCEDVEKYEYNPEKARELLEALGCELGTDGFYYRDGEKISFTINASSTDQVRIDMAAIAAQELREVGLDVTADVPVSIDWGGQQCCIIGWGSPFDADDHTYKVFGTDKGANYSGYSNVLVDKYLTEARENEDTKVRKEAYDKFQKELSETPAYTFFCYIDAIYVAKEGIQGIASDTVLGHHGVGIFWNIRDWVK